MDKKTRVLHVLGRLDRGGAETLVMNIYRSIDRSKVQFDFVKHTEDKCDYDEEILALGGKIYSVPRYNVKNHFYYSNKWRSFFEEHPEIDIIHGHVRSTASIYLGIAKSCGVKTIAHSHSTSSRGNEIEKLIKNILQFPIRFRADYFLACSNDAGKWLFGKNILKEDNYSVLNNAIDVEKYVYNSIKRKKIREKLTIEDKFVIGHVGSFTYPKNHKLLIDIFYKIYKKNNNAVLLLLGDGELKKSIIERIEGLGISNQVVLVGNVENVNEYLQAMDIFVFPSIFEGLGISLIEAQASGLHCIVSKAIPSEAKLTDLVITVESKDTSEWVDCVLESSNLNVNRRTYNDIIYSKGYDIYSIARELELFYISLDNEIIKEV